MKDAILTGDTDDVVLSELLEITASSLTTGTPLFPCLIDEPDFYRKYFKVWVKEGIEEVKKVRELSEEKPGLGT